MSATWESTDALRGDLNRLRRDLDNITNDDLPDHAQKIDQLRRDVDDAEFRADETQGTVRELTEDLSDLSSTVTRLKKSVDWIERYIRSNGATVLDLDNVTKALRDAAARAEKGTIAQEQLLSDSARGALQTQIRQHAAAVTRAKQSVPRLLEATKPITTLDWRDPRHSGARLRYAQARTEWIAAHRQLPGLTTDAQQARQELAADDTARRTHGPTIEAGRKARTQLITELRTRISDAIAAGHLLPLWLHQSLGAMPSPGQTDDWIGTAADIAAYRITYHVTDPVDPLGDLPSAHSARRRTWHYRLSGAIRALTP
ncbi:MAG: hypothetical protein QOE58_3071 [Actinomycetota bacterium]|nr:hypothetical protein [Actinomycetota bacterium]